MKDYKDRWEQPLVNPAITEGEYDSRKVITGIEVERPKVTDTSIFDDYTKKFED